MELQGKNNNNKTNQNKQTNQTNQQNLERLDLKAASCSGRLLAHTPQCHL